MKRIIAIVALSLLCSAEAAEIYTPNGMTGGSVNLTTPRGPGRHCPDWNVGVRDDRGGPSGSHQYDDGAESAGSDR